MKMHFTRPATWLAIGITALTFAGTIHPASADTTNNSQPTRENNTLLIYPLTEGGGLNVNEKGLTMRYTTALQKYLSEAGTGRFNVAIKLDKKAVAPGTFVLEGDLTHAPSTGADGGSYLCTLRLFRQGTPRQLINYWSGYASTLRFLTGNIPGEKRVDKEGLLGELGRRIAAQITTSAIPTPTADQSRTFNDLIERASKVKRLSADIVVDEKSGISSARTTPVVGSLKKGSSFRFRVASQDNGSVYIAAIDASGRPTSVYIPEEGQETDVSQGRPVVVPGLDALSAGNTVGNYEYVVLLRPAIKTGTVATAAGNLEALRGQLHDKSAQNGSMNRTKPESNTRPATTNSVPENTPAPVEIIEAFNGPDTSANLLPVRVIQGIPLRPLPTPVNDDAGIDRLIQLAQTDAPNNWLAYRIQVRVTQ